MNPRLSSSTAGPLHRPPGAAPPTGTSLPVRASLRRRLTGRERQHGHLWRAVEAQVGRHPTGAPTGVDRVRRRLAQPAQVPAAQGREGRRDDPRQDHLPAVAVPRKLQPDPLPTQLVADIGLVRQEQAELVRRHPRHRGRGVGAAAQGVVESDQLAGAPPARPDAPPRCAAPPARPPPASRRSARPRAVVVVAEDGVDPERRAPPPARLDRRGRETIRGAGPRGTAMGGIVPCCTRFAAAATGRAA